MIKPSATRRLRRRPPTPRRRFCRQVRSTQPRPPARRVTPAPRLLITKAALPAARTVRPPPPAPPLDAVGITKSDGGSGGLLAFVVVLAIAVVVGVGFVGRRRLRGEALALPPLDLGRLRGIPKLWRRATPLMSTRAVDENLAPLETPYLRAVGAVQEGLRAVGAAGGYEAPRPPLEYEMQTVGVVESNGGAAHPQVSVAPLCAPSNGFAAPPAEGPDDGVRRRERLE